MKRRAILLNAEDDVATALTDLEEGEEVNASLDNVSVDVVLRDSVDFGHKYALHDIAEGEDVLKYGMPIGKATQDIEAGEWVHTHNCRSDHFGFHRDQYGLKA